MYQRRSLLSDVHFTFIDDLQPWEVLDVLDQYKFRDRSTSLPSVPWFPLESGLCQPEFLGTCRENPRRNFEVGGG